MSTFNALGLIDPLQQVLAELGYRSPTAVQTQAIPAILNGADLVAEAQTGTGKTAAFALPILQELAAEPAVDEIRPIRALVLVPTRELALQVTESLNTYGRYLSLRTIALYGGSRIESQIGQLRRGADILVATPGRLLDLLSQGFFDLRRLEMLVLDEADRMLDLGFIADIRQVRKKMPRRCQTLLFSATLSAAIEQLVPEFLQQPTWVRVTKRNSTAKTVLQFAYAVDQSDKCDVLSYLIQGGQWAQALVFTRTKKRADMVADYLQAEGIDARALHGDKPQRERVGVLAGFSQGKIRILVATDVAARGLDIDSLPRVVNYDLPNVPEAYVHRIGRTGRAGGKGQAISLVAPDEKRYLVAIEALIGRPLSIKPVPYQGSNAADDDHSLRASKNSRLRAKMKPAPVKAAPTPMPEVDDTNTRAVRPSLLSASKKRKK
ncbi:DEAD/DEAH box helicase [Marinobacterium rhizophilum]|uniref:DEAD/DEAH box helicase n=1 Tax=Marinobacterium rhizophilum TaxID=420402 RepID=A0ABY5HGN8_9GAMM|nr:DEAD/DEAH box helicase [Marinobacterium rhizophilum]UTW11536.1 DEAD/DEAH box helicase [Marinobacterium rhizophilum]